MFIFLTYNTLPATHECPQKIQPNRSSRLAGYRQHIYIYTIQPFGRLQATYICTIECLVLLYLYGQWKQVLKITFKLLYTRLSFIGIVQRDINEFIPSLLLLPRTTLPPPASFLEHRTDVSLIIVNYNSIVKRKKSKLFFSFYLIGLLVVYSTSVKI